MRLRSYLSGRLRPLSRAGIAMLLVATVIVAGPRQVSAVAPDEKYVSIVYEDFLLRVPTTAEVSAGVTYLGSNSRTSFVSSILNSSEFRSLWVTGASLYYIDGVDSQFGTILANLGASGNWAASEVAILAGATYFANAGSTNSGFLNSIYLDVLLRAPDPSGYSYWLNRLTLGTSTRAQVASTMIRSSESAAKRVNGAPGATSCPTVRLEDPGSLAAGSYCIVLDRLADPSGATYWSGQLAGSGQLPQLWSSLAGSNEYFNKAQTRP